MRHRRTIRLAVAVVTLAGTALTASEAAGQRPPSPGSSRGHAAEHKNMRLVGAHDLQARSAYQPIIHRQGNRWIAYIGHHGGSAFNPLTGVVEDNGTSIVDVTDPRRPVYLAHIPGPSGLGEAGGAQMVRACDWRLSTSGITAW